jgi:hypothetical protein
MKFKLPKEFGDALLVAAAVLTLVLFGALYVSQPPSGAGVQVAAQTADAPRTVLQRK